MKVQVQVTNPYGGGTNWVQVVGYPVAGGLVAHRQHDCRGKMLKAWGISHMRSGVLVRGAFHTRRAALIWANDESPPVDWTKSWGKLVADGLLDHPRMKASLSGLLTGRSF